MMFRFGGNVCAIVCSLFLLAAASSAGAGGMINTDADDVAISGYDTVAYFTQGRAVPGNAEYQHIWRDAKWWFANAEHRDLFMSDPDRFAPRYGGFCTGGMSLGVRVKADPEAWTIVEGRLYLTSTEDALNRLLRDTQVKIEKAERNWEQLGQ